MKKILMISLLSIACGALNAMESDSASEEAFLVQNTEFKQLVEECQTGVKALSALEEYCEKHDVNINAVEYDASTSCIEWLEAIRNKNDTVKKASEKASDVLCTLAPFRNDEDEAVYDLVTGCINYDFSRKKLQDFLARNAPDGVSEMQYNSKFTLYEWVFNRAKDADRALAERAQEVKGIVNEYLKKIDSDNWLVAGNATDKEKSDLILDAAKNGYALFNLEGLRGWAIENKKESVLDPAKIIYKEATQNTKEVTLAGHLATLDRVEYRYLEDVEGILGIKIESKKVKKPSKTKKLKRSSERAPGSNSKKNDDNNNNNDITNDQFRDLIVGYVNGTEDDFQKIEDGYSSLADKDKILEAIVVKESGADCQADKWLEDQYLLEGNNKAKEVLDLAKVAYSHEETFGKLVDEGVFEGNEFDENYAKIEKLYGNFSVLDIDSIEYDFTTGGKKNVGVHLNEKFFEGSADAEKVLTLVNDSRTSRLMLDGHDKFRWLLEDAGKDAELEQYIKDNNVDIDKVRKNATQTCGQYLESQKTDATHGARATKILGWSEAYRSNKSKKEKDNGKQKSWLTRKNIALTGVLTFIAWFAYNHFYADKDADTGHKVQVK